MIEIFKALADETRLRMVNILNEQNLCVCEIEEILDVSQSNASRHLTRLRTAGIITAEKRSQWVYYKLSDEFLATYDEFWQTVNSLIDRDIYKEDKEKLKHIIKPDKC